MSPGSGASRSALNRRSPQAGHSTSTGFGWSAMTAARRILIPEGLTARRKRRQTGRNTPHLFWGGKMTTGAFLSELAAIIAFMGAAFLFYAVLKALWAEIGPMIGLLFRRGAHAPLDED